MKCLVVLLGSFLFIAFELNFVETCGGYLPILKQRPKLEVYYEQQTRNSRCPTKDGKFVQCTKEAIVQKTREILETYWKTEFGCCTNYEETNPGICKPICQNCGNGTCISPDVCICNPGFNKEENKCVSIYESVCVLAECDSATECKCPEGYKSHNGSREQCEPICINQCENGFCSAPETCTCNEGYKRNPENNHCDPVCEEKCINAVCTSPNICSCIEGYSMRTFSISVCKCDDSGVCVCNAGFENKPDSLYQCVPKCNKECINGNCTNLGLCKCNKGYDFKPGSEYICEELPKSTKTWIASTNEIIGTTTISYNINEDVHRQTTLHGMNENTEMWDERESDEVETNGESYFRWAINDTQIKETTENSYNGNIFNHNSTSSSDVDINAKKWTAEKNEITDITTNSYNNNEVVERSTTFLDVNKNTDIWRPYDDYEIWYPWDNDEGETNEDSYFTWAAMQTTDNTYNSNEVNQNLRISSDEDNNSERLVTSENEITEIIANRYNTTVIHNVTTESSGIAVNTDVAVVNDEQLTENNYNNYSSRETLSNSTISSAESTTEPRGVTDNPNTGTAGNNNNVNTTSKCKFLCDYGICGPHDSCFIIYVYCGIGLIVIVGTIVIILKFVKND